jgi:hypothetical protein
MQRATCGSCIVRMHEAHRRRQNRSAMLHLECHVACCVLYSGCSISLMGPPAPCAMLCRTVRENGADVLHIGGHGTFSCGCTHSRTRTHAHARSHAPTHAPTHGTHPHTHPLCRIAPPTFDDQARLYDIVPFTLRLRWRRGGRDHTTRTAPSGMRCIAHAARPTGLRGRGRVRLDEQRSTDGRSGNAANVGAMVNASLCRLGEQAEWIERQPDYQKMIHSLSPYVVETWEAPQERMVRRAAPRHSPHCPAVD